LSVRVVRLGDPRTPGEGLRLGTVRRLPRGVRKSEYAKRDFFDLWLPELAPSARLVAWATGAPWTDARWRSFSTRYLGEMRQGAAARLLALLALLSRRADFSVGCYCEDASRCHRALLGPLLRRHGARMAGASSPARARSASPRKGAAARRPRAAAARARS
jgi:uncharacterized protein YeaO (DUF488 family)